MIYLFLALLAHIIVTISSIVYMKWFNTFFEKNIGWYYQFNYIPMLFIPILNICIVLFATLVLFFENKIEISKKFSSWWDGEE